nr:MAG TPA: Integrase [Bacteriophage sp.]
MSRETEIVQIMQRQRASGRTTLYLLYRVNGKRYQENTRLYLQPETGKKRAAAVAANKETMRLAKALQAKRVLQLSQERSGIPIKTEPSKMLLTEYINQFIQYKQETTSEGTVSTIRNLQRHLTKYAPESTTLANIDRKFCEGFISYLRRAKGKYGGKLSDITKKVYYTMFGTMLKKAVRDGLLPRNPLDLIDPQNKLPSSESQRVFLDLEEVRKMAEVETPYTLSKQAFMFSCFCGLRISDIRQLEWKDIEEFTNPDGTNQYRLSKRMKKTSRNISYALSKEAISWLPERKGKLVFDGIVSESRINFHIKKMAEQAGITKNVSFHTARHTFATMMLTLGADIYTTSKLLGHTRVSTTEIYAKIVDKKKDDAMGLIDKFFDK